MNHVARRIAVILLLCSACHVACTGAGAQRAGKPVAMSPAEKRKLDTFFSNFAEARLRPFKQGSLTDADLIEFGYRHNLYNSKKGAKSHSDLNVWFGADAVNAAAVKYFGVGIKRHRAVPGILFDGRDYGAPGAEGDPVPFAQIERLYDLGHGCYTGTVSIYERAGDTDPADTHASPSQMAREGAPVTLLKRMDAVVRRIGSGSASRFVLLEQLPIERAQSTHRSPGKTSTAARRCVMPLRDAHGNQFTFSLMCRDEGTHVLTSNDHGPVDPSLTTNMQPGERYRFGHYDMALTPPGQSKPIIQDASLYERTGNYRLVPYTFHIYVVQGGAGDPDLLFWSNFISGRGPWVRAFMISGGRLVCVQFRAAGKAPVDGWQLYNGVKLTRIAPHKYWEYWVMSARTYTHYLWRLDAAKHLLTLDQEIETGNANLPAAARTRGARPSSRKAVSPARSVGK